MEKLSEMLGKDLSSFSVEELHEVWSTDEEGRLSQPLGAFKNKTIAEAFAGNDKKSWSKAVVYPIFVLTDGTNTFAIERERVVKVFDDEMEAVKLRQIAIEKLSPADRAILGV